jgi:hypothetical protein
MDPASKATIAREFADQLQVSTTRCTTRDHAADYKTDALAAIRAAAIRRQAKVAAASFNRRNPAELEPEKPLTAEFCQLIAAYLFRASEADVSVDRLLSELLLQDPPDET